MSEPKKSPFEVDKTQKPSGNAKQLSQETTSIGNVEKNRPFSFIPSLPSPEEMSKVSSFDQDKAKKVIVEKKPMKVKSNDNKINPFVTTWNRIKHRKDIYLCLIKICEYLGLHKRNEVIDLTYIKEELDKCNFKDNEILLLNHLAITIKDYQETKEMLNKFVNFYAKYKLDQYCDIGKFETTYEQHEVQKHELMVELFESTDDVDFLKFVENNY